MSARQGKIHFCDGAGLEQLLETQETLLIPRHDHHARGQLVEAVHDARAVEVYRFRFVRRNVADILDLGKTLKKPVDERAIGRVLGLMHRHSRRFADNDDVVVRVDKFRLCSFIPFCHLVRPGGIGPPAFTMSM